MVRVSLWTSSLLIAFVIGALASGSGCKGDEGVCVEFDCDVGTQLYSCKPTTGLKQYACQPGETAANFWCQSIAGKPAVYIPCEGYGDEAGETGAGAPSWDPSSSVDYDQASGHYLVDEAFVAMLRDDPGLILLDATRVDQPPGTGYYALKNVTQGDLAAAMGLQSGDILISVNRYDLSSIDNMVDAYEALENATSFSVEIERSGQAMFFYYDVVVFIQ